MTNNFIGIQHLKNREEFIDITGFEYFLISDNDIYFLAVFVLGLLFESDLFQIQYNFGNIFNNAFNS